MKNIYYFFLLHFMLSFSLSLWAQDSHQEFNFVNIKEGIPKTGVSSIIQDHHGFIWIGTSGTGLYKFNGIEYTVYRHKLRDSTSLSSSRIECSFLDNKNRLWIGTENGLNIYDRTLDQFRRIVLDHKNTTGEFILSLEQDTSNNLLIGTHGLGLYVLDLDTFSIKKVAKSDREQGIEIFINSIVHSKRGKTFIGTNFGLKEVDFNKNELKQSKLNFVGGEVFHTSIETLFIDSKNNLWIGSQVDKGLFKCSLSNDRSSQIVEVEHIKISSKKIMDIKELSDNTLIIGAENDGLFHIKNNGTVIKNYISSKTEENSILHNSIWSLFVDNDKRIWIGYFNSGVAVSDKLYDKFFDIKSLANNDNSLRFSSVMGIIEDHENNIWIGTDGGGIDIYNPRTSQITHINTQEKSIYTGLTTDYVKTLFIDSKENIWVGSWDSGIFVLKKGEKRFVNYNVENTSGGLKTNTIVSLSEDSEGVIWIGTFSQGLHAFNPKTNEIVKHNSEVFIESNLSLTDVRKVLVDSEDFIWIGTTNGLFRVKKLDNESFEIVALANKMIKGYDNPSDSNHILSIYEGINPNHIWIGTRGAGLCMYDKRKDEFVWYNKFSGLAEENIAAIIEVDDQNLWMSGNRGLTRMDLKHKEFTNYSINDGLLSNDFNFSSVLKGSNGILYFGNFKGVDYFDPEQIKTNNTAPSLYLTDFKLFNEKVIPKVKGGPLNKVIAETDSIRLTHKQSVFTIEYSGLSYTRPEKNSYAYYLEGYETAWNYVGEKRSATYTNLDAGNYVFKLKAANNDGLWNETPLELKITVLPPWWRTNWAIFSYLSLFLFGIYLLNQLTQSRIKEKELIRNERLQQTQKDELNQKKLQFFTNISHEFRTPLTLILNPLKDIISNTEYNLPLKVKNKHTIIYKNADRLYRLINELMDLRKLEFEKMKVRAERLNLVSFCQDIVSYFREEASAKHILLHVDFDMPEVEVWADAKMLEKIIFNLISNAIKVTPDGGTINIELLATDNTYMLPLIDKDHEVKAVEIIISDTGSGLTKDQVSKIFERFYQVEGQNKAYFGGTGIGLEVVQNFVKLHKGEVYVESELGEGTTFKILLASGNAHFMEREILSDENARYKEDKAFLSIPLVNETHKHSEESVQVHKTSTILIVEDNAELRDYLKKELSHTYKVLVAHNGKVGVKLAREAFPDVIITDVIMPEMSGFEFCEIIKNDTSTSHIPLLMLTAKATIENRIEGIEKGADAYMVKPFDLKLLKLRLSQLIKSRQLIFDKYFSAISGAEENKNASSIDKDFIEKLLNYINDHISDSNLGVEALAASLNLSRSQLYRKVKALTGQTVNEFIRKIRLQRAKQILEKGQSNVSEACYHVGFTSPSYFSKCFKAHFGVLPTEIKTK